MNEAVHGLQRRVIREPWRGRVRVIQGKGKKSDVDIKELAKQTNQKEQDKKQPNTPPTRVVEPDKDPGRGQGGTGTKRPDGSGGAAKDQ